MFHYCRLNSPATRSMTPQRSAASASSSDQRTPDHVEKRVDGEHSSIYIDEATFPRSSHVTSTSTI